MSLLMLKTRNLTWQDHTLNIEVMVSPNGSQLLLNKHKTLDAKCMKDKFIFDREQNTFMKYHIAEKRKYHRIKAKLDDKRKQIFSQKVIYPQKDTKLDTVRSFSAPPHLEPRSNSSFDERLPSQRHRPSTMEGVQKRSKVVLGSDVKLNAETETSNAEQLGKEQVCRNHFTGDNVFLTQISTSEPEVVAKSQCLTKKMIFRPKMEPLFQHNISERVGSVAKSRKSVKFDEEVEGTTEDNYIDRKVKEFILSLMQFNCQGSSSSTPKYANCFVKPDGSVTRRFAAIVGQYSYLSKDSVSVLQAFDNFCKDCSDKTEFQKFLKYVSRFNLGIGRQPRSRSSVPVVTASQQDARQRKDI